MTAAARDVAASQPEVFAEFAHLHRFFDPVECTDSVKILPGELYVTRRVEIVTTVLGSCVAACIRDPVAGVGGMNHFLLPSCERGGGAASEVLSDAMRYGNFAMECLVNTILKYGGRRERLEIKLFGGGRIMSDMTDVGASNVRFVMQYLRSEGLVAVAADVGDVHPRRVVYYPISGRVRVKRLAAVSMRGIAAGEKEYSKRIGERPVGGDVELF